VQGAVHRAQQQRQRARAGGVGHQHADAAPVERVGRELLVHERRDLVLVEDGRGVPDPRGRGRQAGRDLADQRHAPTL
jgi:hypothetical protein